MSNLVQAVIERMRREVREKEEQAGGEEKVSVWDKLEKGVNVRRFLPMPVTSEYDNPFAVQRMEHYRRKKFLHTCITTQFKANGNPVEGTRCRTCKRFLAQLSLLNQRYEQGSAEAKARYKDLCQKYKPKIKCYSVVYRPKTQDFKILSYGVMVLEQLIKYLIDEDCGDFSDLETGRDMRIVKKVIGSRAEDVQYEITKEGGRYVLGTPEDMATWDIPDINAVVPPLPTPKEIDEVYARIEEMEAQQAQAVKEEAEEEASVASQADAQAYPECFGDPEIHNPQDPACQGCALYEECHNQPQIQAKLTRRTAAQKPSGLDRLKQDLKKKSR